MLTIPATTLKAFLSDVPNVDLLKIDAEGYDFEILSGAGLDAIKPDIIFVEFGVHFPSQPLEEIRRSLADMDRLGYRAVIFELKKMPGFGTTNWKHKLVDIIFDSNEIGKKGDAFGNILFYQKENTAFPVFLLNWIEAFLPACQRPISQAIRSG